MSIATRALKAVVRPFVRPLVRRYLDPLGRRIDGIQDLAVRLDHHLPLVENAIASQNAELRSGARESAHVRAELERLEGDLARTRQHVEALREDLALALGPGAPVAEGPAQIAPAPVISDPPGERRGGLRLSFRYGAPSVPDHVDVDLAELRGADLVAALRGLPFTECSAVEIRASRVLELFSIADLRELVLPYWLSLLRPGGHLVATGIDAEANLADHQAGRLGLEELAALSFGVREGSPTRHHSMLSEDLLRRLLEEAGFESITILSRWRGDDAVNRMEVGAQRGDPAPVPAELASRTDLHR